MNPRTWQNTTDFEDVFEAGVGNTPYAYQCRLACGVPPPGANGETNRPDEATRRWLASSDPKGCYYRRINIQPASAKPPPNNVPFHATAKLSQPV